MGLVLQLVVIYLLAELPEIYPKLLLAIKVLVETSNKLSFSLLALKEYKDCLFKVADRHYFKHVWLFDWTPVPQRVVFIDAILDIIFQT